MQEPRNNQKEYSTCLEALPFAEAMQKPDSRPEDVSSGGRVNDGRTGSFSAKKTAGNALLESIMNLHRCADCPIRRAAIRNPHSLFSRIHSGHAT